MCSIYYIFLTPPRLLEKTYLCWYVSGKYAMGKMWLFIALCDFEHVTKVIRLSIASCMKLIS